MSLARAVLGEDGWRCPRPRRAPVREWQHFIVFAPGLELLVNFSLSRAPGASDRARVIVMARCEGRWLGLVDGADPGVTGVSRDGKRFRAAGGTLELVDGHYRVVVHQPRRGVELELRVVPEAMALVAPNQPIGDRRRLSWLIAPRALATGTVRLGDARFELAGAPTYHDHNWGEFAWGDDFCWEWGVALPDAPGRDEAVVFSSLQSRARGRTTVEQLFWWQGGRNALAASGAELEVCFRGPSRADASFRLPAVAGLLRRRNDADLPREVELRARRRGATLALDLRVEDVAELVIPSDRQPTGLVTIHECVGPVDFVCTNAAGETQRWTGRGVFEFVRVSPGPRSRVSPGPRSRPRPCALTGALEPPTLRAWVELALELLERTSPSLASALAESLTEALGDGGLELRVGEERLHLAVVDGQTRCVAERPAPVGLRTTHATVLELLDGALGFEAALRRGDLELRAGVASLGALGRAAQVFIHGLMRSGRGPELACALRELPSARTPLAGELHAHH